MKANRASIYWLDTFGLSVGQLASLGSLKIKLHVCLRHIDEKSLFKLKPAQRLKKMNHHYEVLFSRVKKNWGGPLNISWIRRQPRSFAASVEARRVSSILRMPEIRHVFICDIPGRKRVSAKPKERWFAVKARFAIHIEGQTTGLQTYEDRIVIVKAIGGEDAENKLQPGFKKYGTPYLNPHGFMARWAFERVLDVYEIGDEKIDEKGVEVFSVLAKRRIKPEYVWKPDHNEQVHLK